MSTLNYCHETEEVLLRHLKGPRTFNHTKLKDDNLNKVIDCQLMWLLLLVDIRQSEGINTRKQKLIAVSKTLASTDTMEWLLALDSLRDGLIQSCSYENNKTLSMILEDEQHTSLTWLLDFLRPIVDDWYVRFDISAFNLLLQAFSFCKRLSLDITMLKESAYLKWQACEKHMAEVDRDVPVCFSNPERRVLSEWFPIEHKDLVYAHFMPHHGAGAIASFTPQEDHSSWQYKWRNLSFTPQCVWFLQEIGFGDLASTDLMQNLGYIVPSGCDWYSADYLEYLGVTKTIAKVIFVNKSWKTYRTISAEPVGNMWVQQGIGEVLNWYLKDSHLTGISKYYSVDSEGLNRKLAIIGSENGAYATIDFSSASDCVNFQQVANMFRDTWLYEAIASVRTPYAATPDGSIYDISKHAQMGSRMCFPIMCFILCAVARTVIEDIEGTTIDDLTSRPGLPPFVVYGDDVVIRAKYAEAFIARCEELGFMVNTDKSYCYTHSLHFYRESCGVEALDGIDITPIYLSRKFPGLPNEQVWDGTASSTIDGSDGKRLASTITLANSVIGYPILHACLVSRVRKALNGCVYFSRRGGAGLWTDDPRPNHHLSVKYDEDLQAPYIEAFALHPDIRTYFETLSHVKGRADLYDLNNAALFEELRLGYKRQLADLSRSDRLPSYDRRMPDPLDSIVFDPVSYVEDVVGEVSRIYWPDL